MIERLCFSEVRDAYPDRYEKVDLLAAKLVEEDRGRFIVHRDGSDQAHPCQLVTAHGDAWGRCECPGFEHNDGPCSHLCAVWRANQREMLDLPRARVEAIQATVLDPDQAAADRVDARPEAATDGGRR